jgi:hypothetical protein
MIRILLAAIVLLHALVTGPLLVQCLTADGHALTELLGHDPCHLQSGTAETGIGSGTPVDPCADLLMSDAAVIQAGIQSPAPQPDGVLFHPERVPGEGAANLPASAWKPPFGPNAVPRIEFSLRV